MCKAVHVNATTIYSPDSKYTDLLFALELAVGRNGRSESSQFFLRLTTGPASLHFTFPGTLFVPP